MEFENLNNEFNEIRGEYISNEEYDFIEEKIEEPEEFYNKIQLKDRSIKENKTENNKLSDSSSESSSMQQQSVSTNTNVIHKLNAMGTAASAMTICVAAAGISIYSSNFDSNTIITGDSVSAEEQREETQIVLNEPEQIIDEDEVQTEDEAVIEEEINDNTEIKNFSVLSESYTGIYDGESHYGNLVNVPEDAVITYGETKENCNLTQMPQYTEAGEYTVYYKVEKAGYETYIGNFIVRIDKKIVAAPSPDIEAGIYNGKMQGPGLTDSGDYTCSGKISAIDAGTYKLNLQLHDKNNYQWSDGNSEDKTVTWTIRPRELKINWQNQNEFIYDGTKHTIYVTLENIIAGDFLNFTVKDHRGINPGIYTAEVLYFEGSDNYILPEECTYEWSIIAKDENIEYGQVIQN